MSIFRRDAIPIRYVLRDLGWRLALAEAWAQIRNAPTCATAEVDVHGQVVNVQPVEGEP